MNITFFLKLIGGYPMIETANTTLKETLTNNICNKLQLLFLFDVHNSLVVNCIIQNKIFWK